MGREVAANCSGRVPPSNGKRGLLTALPMLPRVAEGDGFCWPDADLTAVEEPSAGMLLRAAEPDGERRATES